MNYLVIVDRYSNWPIVERAQDGSKGLVDVLWQTFATYGIPMNLLLMEALSLSPIPPGHFYLIGVFTTDSVLWLSLMATVEQKWELRQSNN